ncbi:MAG: peptidoglycan DD-metalloendopeptidase family protein [Oscillospiraceae bacterium]|nr:peptidoglycan DD-metalloendopeptidase family protein [Oscillospiraceae bacterium]
MAQTVLGRTPSRTFAQPGYSVNTICREASRLTARRYKTAYRRAGLEQVAARLVRLFSALFSGLSRLAVPFRFIASAFVYIAAGCAERVRYASRGASFSLEASGAAARKKQNLRRANTALAFMAAGVLLFAASIYRVGLEVILDGESIGYVSNQSIVENSLSAVSAQAGEILGRPFTVVPNIEYRFTIVNKNKIFDSAGVEAGLLGSIPDIDRLCVLTIDGVPIGAARSPGELHNVLDAFISGYSSAGQASFLQDTSIQSRLAPISLLRGEDELLSILIGSARSGNALLSVKTVEQISYTQVVPFETEYVEDPAVWTGEVVVRTQGVNGEALVMAERTSIDGGDPAIDETGRLMVSEPVTEVIATGTRTRLATGTFIRPYYGRLSSSFGMRKIFGSYSMHYGVDFAGPIGEPIVAADGGTVEFAGTKPGYGLCVFIDHQNGYKTVYAHCSKVFVKAGDKVGQGEKIANIGNTGRSTGPHVHFEVQVNGVQKNPMNYLGK